MKKLLLGMLAIMMLAMSGCGGSTVTVDVPVGPVINPPALTSYQFSQDTLHEFVDGSVAFYAPDSDIDSITVVVFDSRGFEISRTITPHNLSGLTQGTVLFSIDYLTFPNDTYTFSIFVTDFNGNTSNRIVDTFRVP